MKDILVDYMVRTGVPLNVAEICASKIVSDVKFGATIGFTVGYYTKNIGAMIMGVAMGAGFGAATAIGSPSCEGVREAAYRIAFDI